MEALKEEEFVRLGLYVSVAACTLWIVVRLATLPGVYLRAGFRVFISVVTLGFILAEATARIVVSKCDPEKLLKHARRAEDSSTEDDMEYAAM